MASLCLSPGSLGAQTLAGQVLDQTAGTPVALARITLLDLEGHPVVFTLSDKDGYFLVTAPIAGQYLVNAESGFYWSYSDGPVALSAGDTLMVEFTLAPHPTELDEIVVRGTRRPWRMVLGGYYERAQSGLGWQLDREMLERHSFRRISDALFSVPGVTLLDAGFGDKEPTFVRARGWNNLVSPQAFASACFPRVFLDGMQFSPGGSVPTEIDRLLHPEDVEAIEIYKSAMEVPGRFGGSGATCGVIAIWSR